MSEAQALNQIYCNLGHEIEEHDSRGPDNINGLSKAELQVLTDLSSVAQQVLDNILDATALHLTLEKAGLVGEYFD